MSQTSLSLPICCKHKKNNNFFPRSDQFFIVENYKELYHCKGGTLFREWKVKYYKNVKLAFTFR